MIVKKHSQNNKLVLAICDEDLLGKTIEENDLVLDLKSNFYRGEKTTEQELEKLLKTSYIVNAVGKNSIEFLEKQGLIKKENAKIIAKTPCVQIVIEKN
jgi:hypothetical protein